MQTSPEPASRSVKLGLWLLIGLALLTWVWFPTRGFPGDERAEITVKAALSCVAIVLLFLGFLSRDERNPRRAGLALILLSVVAGLAYVNFGKFHGGPFVHHWEQFHYTLGSKYFPELGYDGLYAASLAAEAESYPERTQQAHVRDLRSNEVVAADSQAVAAHREEVLSRFSRERWTEFVRDHRFFLDNLRGSYLVRARQDHGFNPPPSWTFVARLFSSWVALRDTGTLAALASLDLVLLAVMFVTVFRTWGARVGCLSLALFGLGYAGRFYWVGGAFLREDWLAASVIGICLLKRERYIGAGAAFGYAAMVRVFPVLFLFGPAILGLRAALRREDKLWILKLGAGCLAMSMLLGLLGGFAGRGFEAWGEFFGSISLHRQTWLTNNVGLDNVVLYDGETLRGELVNFDLPEPWVHWQAKMDGLRESRQLWLWLARLALLGFLARAAWRSGPAQAAALGIGAVFTLTLTTCYYWQMLLVLPFLGAWWIVLAALGLNAAVHLLHFASPAFEFRYGLMSWGLLVLLVSVSIALARSRRPAPRDPTG